MKNLAKNGSILIVDDNPTNLSLLKRTLTDVGWKVRLEMSGESAIEQIKNRPPDLVLLDVQMPGIDGFETCRRLKSDPETADIPILFMTALADAESKIKGLSLGAVDYITKPFEQEEVVARVNIHLQLRQLTRSLEQQVTERTQALQQAQIQLVQQEKLSSLGQLVAGVAHEINNPLGCMVNNLAPAQEYIADLIRILKLYQQQFPQPGDIIESEIEIVDLEFIVEDLPNLLSSMKLSTDRVKDISICLRNFARSDSDTKVKADLHEGLDSTLLILHHRLKAVGTRPEIKIIKQYGEIPPIECYPGQLNQVFMNILSNAIEAIEESNQQRGVKEIEVCLNCITIKTSAIADRVIISIFDNGIGITEDVKAKIFDYLFTTKAVGKGTGLGLAIAHQIVVEKHSGSLSVNSIYGQGTEFTIALPLL